MSSITSILKYIPERERCCCFCNNKKDLTLDHIKPLSLGGKNDPVNWQVLCYECNQEKGNKYPYKLELSIQVIRYMSAKIIKAWRTEQGRAKNLKKKNPTDWYFTIQGDRDRKV